MLRGPSPPSRTAGRNKCHAPPMHIGPQILWMVCAVWCTLLIMFRWFRVFALIPVGLLLATLAAAPAGLPGEALVWLRRANRDAQTLTQGDLLARLAGVQAQAGEIDNYRRSLGAAQASAKLILDARKQSQVLIQIAGACLRAQDQAAYQSNLAAAMDVIGRIQDAVDRGNACIDLAVAQIKGGDLSGWKRTAQLMPLAYYRGQIYQAAAAAARSVGAMETCREATRAAHEAMLAMSDPNQQYALQGDVARMYAMTGDWETATSLAAGVPDLTWRAYAHLKLADEARSAKDTDRARTLLEVARQTPLAKMKFGELSVLVRIADIENDLGDKENCRKTLQRAAEYADAYINPAQRALLHYELAAAQIILGEAEGGAKSLKIADEARDQIKDPGPGLPAALSQRFLDLAQASASVGDVERAKLFIRDIHDVNQRMTAYRNVAVLLAQRGRFRQAVDVLANVVDEDTRMGTVRDMATAFARDENNAFLSSWIDSLSNPRERVEVCLAVIAVKSEKK